MSSIYLRPTRGSSRLLRRTLVTSSRLADKQIQYDSQGDSDPSSSSSSSSSSQPSSEIKNSKTVEFLYGSESNWRKPKIPSKPATPPKKRAKVDPEAYKNLPPLEPQQREIKEKLIDFSLAEGQSNDRKFYFSNDIENELGQEDWSSAEIIESEVGLENGRVVECRRSGMTTIGLILASISLSGKQRLLLLRSSGEIWPISSHDIQFIMPSSLILPKLASKCWSIELLESLSQTESKSGLTEDSIQPTSEMLDARRKVAMVLRKVHRETEKMCGRLTSGTITNNNGGGKDGQSGGVELVWNHFAPERNSEERTCITAVQAAEFILNPETTDQNQNKKIEIKPNTLPAYAAHILLMRRPDLFTADQGDMWSSGTFVVRSRSERRLVESVQKGLDGAKNTEDNDGALSSFIEKVRKVLEVSRKVREETEGQELKEIKNDLPEWTTKDKEYISILLSPLVETRSTQTPPSFPLALSIVRLISPESNEIIDRGTIARLLSDIGVILPWDSLELSKLTESENRSMIMSSIPTTISGGGTVKGENELLKGNELDHLREDFTNHKVFVIDDPTASELDDGISLERIDNDNENVWVHIHIADPTRFLTPNHPSSKQASIRGSSAYLPEGNKPLFPLDVIMKELSLGAEIKDSTNGGAQGTMTFSAKINKSGQVDETKVRMGWIKKPRVVTYQAVDKALGLPTSKSTRPFGGPVRTVENQKMDIEPTDLEDLRLLYDIAKAHRARRYATAGFEWTLPSASINLLNRPSTPSSNLFDPNALLTSPKLYSGSLGLEYKVSTGGNNGMNSAGLVAEYMIIAGKLSAEFCYSRQIPVIYRGSFAPKPLNSEIGTIEGLLASRIEGTGQIDPYKMLQPGWYRSQGFIDIKPLEHWIMGFDKKYQDEEIKGYIRSTSPLRRFDDFLVHWQIKSYLAKESGINNNLSKSYSKEEVINLVKRSDEGFKRSKRAGLNANKFWQARVLSNYLNDSPQIREGWEINQEEKIDIKNDILIGKISGLTESAPSIQGEFTPIIIDSLGLQCKLSHKVKKMDFKVGEEVKCKIDMVQDWPNPIVHAKLVE